MKEDEEKESRAIAAAERRDHEVQFDRVGVMTLVVGNRDLWTGGFATTVHGSPLMALLGGRGMSVDSIELTLVHDLPVYLGESSM